MLVQKTLIALGALAATLAGVVTVQPDSFHIERSVVMAAPRERAFAEVNDLHAWRGWSPWEDKDPAMKRGYSGASSGVGAVYTWSGNREVGEGRMTIERSEPSEIVIKLEFIQPFAGTDTATYSFAEVPGGTRVTWAMDGKKNFVSKAFHMVFDVDKLLGADFERGLARMKAVAEQGTNGAVANAP